MIERRGANENQPGAILPDPVSEDGIVPGGDRSGQDADAEGPRGAKPDGTPRQPPKPEKK